MISRRAFLRSAGGITALALTPAGKGLFAAPASADGSRLPLFTVTPYIQPGSGSALVDGRESLVVAWQTLDGVDAEARQNWTAALEGLSLGRKYFYRVRGNGVALANGYFTTRHPRG